MESIMSNSKTGCDGISRRVVLTGAAVALSAAGATMTAKQAVAQQKISKAAAKYQDTPKGKQQCDNCVQFIPPNACKFVEGNISPKGWCMLYAPKT
jgi:hypothetical protein